MADAASSIDWLADSSRCIGYGCWLPAMERAEASWQSSLLGTTLSDKFGVGIVPDQLKQPSCHSFQLPAASGCMSELMESLII
ncbi:hypothetical protein TgHK011_001879 [Trichoderma gracile]|nr:hypothetical protein TgHK011_001879 [Trichoderma gracile]